MPKFANFVQCSLVASITAGATTIQVEAEAPFNLPPNPAGQTAYVTIMDDLNSPTKFEIVGYTGVTTIDATSLELTGCIRAQQGTTAQGWGAGDETAFVRQDITSRILEDRNVFEGRLYAAFDDTSVRAYNNAGEEVLYWLEGEHKLGNIEADNLGYVYIITKGEELIRISPSGEEVFRVGLAHTIRDGTDIEFPAGIDGAGNFYYWYGDPTLGVPNAVRKYDPQGNLVWTQDSAVPRFRSMAVDFAGNVFGADSSDPKLYRIFPDGAMAEIGSNVLRVDQIPEIAVSNDEWVYVSQWEDILKVSYEGDVLATFTHPSTLKFQHIAVTADGGFVVHNNAGDLERYDSSGTRIWRETEDVLFGFFDPPAIYITRDQKILTAQQGASSLNNELEISSLETGAVELRVSVNAVPTALSVTPYIKGNVVFADGFERTTGLVKYSEIASKPASVDAQTYKEIAAPNSPPAGKCYVYLDSFDGAYKVKFSNGVVKTIATP